MTKDTEGPASDGEIAAQIAALRAEIAALASGLGGIARYVEEQRAKEAAGQAHDKLVIDYLKHLTTQIDGVHHWLHHLVTEQTQAKMQALWAEDQRRDLVLSLIARELPALGWTFRADRAVALDSADHVVPKGTINDNSRHPRFVAACEAHFRAPIRHVDLGCAGGGLVWDFTLNGHQSVGVEGSDRSRRERRAEWRMIPDRLFTADIRFPFSFADTSGEPVRFDLATAWEVFEHIPESDIDGLLANIRGNLRRGGLLVASVATNEDVDPETGAVWHVTLRPRDWWIEKCRRAGLSPIETHGFELADFVRGSGNPRAPDIDFRAQPEMGFHLVLEAVELAAG